MVFSPMPMNVDCPAQLGPSSSEVPSYTALVTSSREHHFSIHVMKRFSSSDSRIDARVLDHMKLGLGDEKCA